jgi:hypothetical protein
LSAKIAQLSPEAMALFCLLIPHFNSHGKMLADPHAIKGTVCPLIIWMTVEKIKECLVEISSKTNVRWWRDEKGLHYLQSLSWGDHQTLRKDRLGSDHLPDYPGDKSTNPDQLPDYSRSTPAKGKLREVEGKSKEKVKSKLSSDSLRLSGILAEMIADNNPRNRSVSGDKREGSIASWAADIDKMLRLDKRSAVEVEETIYWCQQDSFWLTNILSGQKLRDKFDNLQMQMRRADSSKGGSQAFESIEAGRRVI